VRAKDIYRLLAEAEASVHGVSLDEVAFHEVGAQDSIADVVAAAVLLDRLEHKHGTLTASTSSLPLGAGRVRTAHGELPVPAPATLRLLEGLVVHDDQRLGERVTPTGAAIVRHLKTSARTSGVVVGSGVGFGTKIFAGLSNILRVTLTRDAAAAATAWTEAPLLILTAEIDDMTAEELAMAADRLRACVGVVDVCFMAVTMKKGRPATRLQVLVSDPGVVDVVVAAVFDQTSTLGVRKEQVSRCELRREITAVDGVRRKTAQRPGGTTAKVDVDDVAGDTLALRRARRQDCER